MLSITWSSLSFSSIVTHAFYIWHRTDGTNNLCILKVIISHVIIIIIDEINIFFNSSENTSKKQKKPLPAHSYNNTNTQKVFPPSITWKRDKFPDKKHRSYNIQIKKLSHCIYSSYKIDNSKILLWKTLAKKRYHVYVRLGKMKDEHNTNEVKFRLSK